MMEWNLRVSAALHQGDRKYMEDQYAIHYECDKETGKFLYAYFGIFDGHGGADAAKYAKANLHKNITNHILFWSDDPNDILSAIEEGFSTTHEDMWKELGNWPVTATGLPSTAGTTASIAIIRGGKLYTGHVGDSGISLGSQPESLGKGKWTSKHLTEDHKPDSPAEKCRIEQMGGRVVPKAGVPRVVWQRPRYKGPVRRPSEVDHIPFLAVGRALGDLWSYNFNNDEYAISPVPDVQVWDFDPYKHKCLILASDGLWNLLDPKGAVATVEMTDRKWFREAVYEKGYPKTGDPYYHHASTLVNIVLRRWRTRNLRADNTSAIVVMVDPAGPAVQKSLDKITSLAAQTRNRGEKFCARTYLRDCKEPLSNCDRYVLGMAGSYNIQYYDDNDRFELMFGKPAIRYNKPKNQNVAGATSSISMYDVIIHKVMTPAKSTSSMPALASASRFSNLKRSQSNKELGRLKSLASSRSSLGCKLDSWLDAADDDGEEVVEEVDDSNPDNLPLYLDHEENTVKKPNEALIQDESSESPEEGSPTSSTTKPVFELSCNPPEPLSLHSAADLIPPPPPPATSTSQDSPTTQQPCDSSSESNIHAASGCKPEPSNKEGERSCTPEPSNKEGERSCKPEPSNKEGETSCKAISSSSAGASCKAQPENKVIKCLRSMAHSLVSLADHTMITRKKSLTTADRPIAAITTVAAKRSSALPNTAASSVQLRVKRKSSSVVLSTQKKRMRMSAPNIQLTKFSSLSSPPVLRSQTK